MTLKKWHPDGKTLKFCSIDQVDRVYLSLSWFSSASMSGFVPGERVGGFHVVGKYQIKATAALCVAYSFSRIFFSLFSSSSSIHLIFVFFFSVSVRSKQSRCLLFFFCYPLHHCLRLLSYFFHLSFRPLLHFIIFFLSLFTQFLSIFPFVSISCSSSLSGERVGAVHVVCNDCIKAADAFLNSLQESIIRASFKSIKLIVCANNKNTKVPNFWRLQN